MRMLKRPFSGCCDLRLRMEKQTQITPVSSYEVPAELRKPVE